MITPGCSTLLTGIVACPANGKTRTGWLIRFLACSIVTTVHKPAAWVTLWGAVYWDVASTVWTAGRNVGACGLKTGLGEVLRGSFLMH